jgi:glycosyltransferase involved in cell wall biosynthesis
MSRHPPSGRPLISAVVPAFNAERHLPATLRSLLHQSYSNLEIIVVDDGSTDGTLSVVNEMARRHPRLRVVRQPNSGVAAARNHGVLKSRGDFIAPVDADDLWFPDAAEKLVSCLLSSDPQAGVAYGWSLTLDEEGRADGGLRCSTIQGEVFRTLLCHNFIGNASSTLIRRTCFERAGGYDPWFRDQGAQGCEDWDLYLRISEFAHFRVAPEFIVGYRRPAGSMSADVASMARSHEHLLQKTGRRHPDIHGVLYRISTSSFQLHLARECRRLGMPQDSSRWLKKAFVEGLPLSMLRPGFYTLATRNALASLRPGPGSGPGGTRDALSDAMCSESPDAQPPRIGDGIRRRLLIRSKIATQKILHGLISRLPKT